MEGPGGADPRLRTATLRRRGYVEAMRGDFDRAWGLAGRVAGFGQGVRSGWGPVDGLITAGRIAMLEGDPARAEHEFAGVVGSFRASATSAISPAWHRSSPTPSMRRDATTRRCSLTEEAERATIEGDIDAQVHWRRVRAKVLARGGRLDEALALATGAADMVRRSDDLDKRGQALLDLAEVLRLAGRSDDASAAARGAVDALSAGGTS